jgi:hypothetical protein
MDPACAFLGGCCHDDVGREGSAGGELGGHLGEVCTQLRAGVDDEIDTSGAGKRDAHEGVGSLEEMIALEAASGCSEMMQS